MKTKNAGMMPRYITCATFYQKKIGSCNIKIILRLTCIGLNFGTLNAFQPIFNQFNADR